MAKSKKNIQNIPDAIHEEVECIILTVNNTFIDAGGICT